MRRKEIYLIIEYTSGRVGRILVVYNGVLCCCRYYNGKGGQHRKLSHGRTLLNGDIQFPQIFVIRACANKYLVFAWLHTHGIGCRIPELEAFVG